MRKKVFSTLIALFLLASLVPTFYEIAHRDRLPPIREFELVHNFPTDFNFYLSRIRQGIEGNVTVREQYTSEPHKGSFIHVFYLWLGWLGRGVRVPWHRAADVYHVARIVFGGLLLVMIAEFCRKAYYPPPLSSRDPAQRGVAIPLGLLRRFAPRNDSLGILAFLLAVTASTWPKLLSLVNDQIVPATRENIAGWRLGGYMSWWSVMDSLQRITFIPHLLVGQALILFLVMAMSDEETMKKSGNWIFLGILAFTLGIIFPPGLLFVIVTTGLLTILEVFYEIIGSKKIAVANLLTPMRLVKRAIVLGLGIPSLLYLSLMTSFYPWKRLVEFDIVKPLPFDYVEYFKAVGPILPIGIIGLFVVLWRKEASLLPAVAWILAWGLLLFVFRFIPSQSPLRFSEMIPHVPLAVLASYVFYKIYNRYPAEQGLASRDKHYKYYIAFIPAALILLGGGVMYSSWLWQRDFVDHKMRASYPLVPTGSYVMYPLKDFIAAIRYLQDATGNRQTVILSETTAGNYMSVYSGNTVYVGHANTVKAEEKERIVKEFFSGHMKPDEARAFLERENLHWIFFGPQEKEDGGVSDLAKVYPFLSEAYKNTFVTVFHKL